VLLTIRPVTSSSDPVDRPGGADRPVSPASADETVGSGELSDTLSFEVPGFVAPGFGVSPGSFGGSPIEVAVRSTRPGHDSVVRVRRISLAGDVLAEVTLPVRLSDAGVAVVALPESVGVVDDPTNELVVADMDWRRAVWTPAPDKDMRWVPARYRTSVSTAGDDDGVELVVEAESLVRDLLVQPDRVSPEGTVDRGFMTLLPGERVVFRVRGVTAADEGTLTAAPVLWTLDQVFQY
jgi:beta-mannosidase